MHEAMILRSIGQQMSVSNSVTRDYSNLELQRTILRLLDDRQIRRNGQPLTTQSHHYAKKISENLTL